MKSKPGSHTIRVVTLGCFKNLVDSEVLMKQLEANQIEIIPEYSRRKADSVIINTCGFIRDAKEESVDTILRYVEKKQAGKLRNIYVIGCLSERYKEDLRAEVPDVDRYFGVNDLEEILREVGGEYRKELVGERYMTGPGHYAYLKISEGCDRTCAFCAIPRIRGRHLSRPVEELVRESTLLAAQGVKELILIAQDLSYYGFDLYGKQKLRHLLEHLAAVKGIEWIRLHYAYPALFPVDILPLVREKENICSYLDIPFQHINDTLLQMMRRGSTKTEILRLISRIRKEVPGIALRTTLLVGHPGETAREYDELIRFVKEVRFDRLGVFTYSHEEGTYGYGNYRDLIPEAVKQYRKHRLMEIQMDISKELNDIKIGGLFKVIVDDFTDGYYTGRTEHDSPEVDNAVRIVQEKRTLQPGTFYPVRITRADAYDLYGEIG